MSNPLRILYNETNLLRTATLIPSSVEPAENTVLPVPAVRKGTASLALTGAYTGFEDATIDVQIVDVEADTKRASTPVLIGAGSGTLTDITASAFAAQAVTVALKDAGIPIIAASTNFEGVKLVARAAGADGNNIHINIAQAGPPTTAYWFHETFTGSGDLTTHMPEVGGAYTLSSGSGLSAYVLNGTGGLPAQTTTTHDAKSAISDPGTTWTFELDFTITALGSGHLEFELATEKTSGLGDVFDLESAFDWNGTAWAFEAYTAADDSGPIDVTAALTVGNHTHTILASPSGVVYKIDGAIVYSSATVLSTPTHALFENWKNGSGSGVTLNEISLTATAAGIALNYADSNYSLITDLKAGQGGPTSPLIGAAYGWITPVLGTDNILPDPPQRIAFGDDATVYRPYGQWVGDHWEYHFVPALLRDIPAGTRIKTVSGGRTVEVIDSTNSPATVETYDDVESVYDALHQIKEGSALVAVDGIVANDHSPTGQAARDLLVRTDAHAEPSYGSGGLYAKGLEFVFVTEDAGTELVTARCYAVNGNDHPLAHLGAERWIVNSTLTGALADAVTGVPYATDKWGFTIPERLPPGTATRIGDFGLVQITYAGRSEGESEPPICVAFAPLGPNAIDDTIVLTYKHRPSDACKCADMPEPSFSATCLGTLTGESAMAYSTDARTRLEALYDFASTLAAAVTSYISGFQFNGVPTAEIIGTIGYSASHATAVDGGVTISRTLAQVDGDQEGAFPLESGCQPATFAAFGLPADFQAVVDSFGDAIKLIDALDPGTDKTAGWTKFDLALTAINDDLVGVTSPLVERFASIAGEKYRILLRTALAYAGLDPAGKSDASTITGDGCWQDYHDPAWWLVVGSNGGSYAPAFSNHPYYSSRQASTGGYYSTHQFGFELLIKCPGQLKDGDRIELSIKGASLQATYQIGDVLSLPVIAGRDVYLTGGQDGTTLTTWNVTGSAAGPMAPYALDTAAPTPYSSGGLAFQITPGGVPFKLGDEFRFAIEGGHFQWRVNAGAWNMDSPPLDIPDGVLLLYAGLSLDFGSGNAPSFAINDVYSFRVLQPRRASNLQTPTPEAWKWTGSSAYMTFDLGSGEPVPNFAIALHTLPIGCTITVEGAAADASPWSPDWTEMLTRVEGPIVAEFNGRTAQFLRLTVTDADGAEIGYARAGEAITTELTADLDPLSRVYRMKRGAGGLYQRGRYLGKAVSGSLTWSEGALPEADVQTLIAMTDYLKTNGDQAVIIVPNITRPSEAFMGQVAADQIDWPELSGGTRNAGVARRYSRFALPVSGVYFR